jgi:hypothetical protein
VNKVRCKALPKSEVDEVAVLIEDKSEGSDPASGRNPLPHHLLYMREPVPYVTGVTIVALSLLAQPFGLTSENFVKAKFREPTSF